MCTLGLEGGCGVTAGGGGSEIGVVDRPEPTGSCGPWLGPESLLIVVRYYWRPWHLTVVVTGSRRPAWSLWWVWAMWVSGYLIKPRSQAVEAVHMVTHECIWDKCLRLGIGTDVKNLFQLFLNRKTSLVSLRKV